MNSLINISAACALKRLSIARFLTTIFVALSCFCITSCQKSATIVYGSHKDPRQKSASRPLKVKVTSVAKSGYQGVVDESDKLDKRKPATAASASASSFVSLKSPNTTKDSYVSSNSLKTSIRFYWPVQGEIISSFGYKGDGVYNNGINIKISDGGEVKAAAPGLVVYVGNKLKAYGNLIIIRHENGWLTAYAHNKDIIVKKGEKVVAGQKIAHGGNTGNVTDPQLYFSIRSGRNALNPILYLTKA